MTINRTQSAVLKYISLAVLGTTSFLQVSDASDYQPINLNQSGSLTQQLTYKSTINVNENGTYDDKTIQSLKLLGIKGESELNPFNITYSSALSKLKVLNAWVVTPSGKKIVIPSSNIFTRPVPVSVGAPMYSRSKVISIIPPKMNVGDVLHVSTSKVFFKPYFPGNYSNYWLIPENESVGSQIIQITAPASMHLRVAQKGGWDISHHLEDGKEIIKAKYNDHVADYPGLDTVGMRQYSPLFEVTSFPSWASVGTAYWKRAKEKAKVTPLVLKVADEATAGQTGWNAQKALFSWDSANIRYVGLELGVGGFVPISANKTLSTGYGDCKAHSTLLQALFNAKKFTLYPTIINWDNVYNLPPLPTPFWFNHAIDYAPKKHIFLDSTGQYETPGQLAVGERSKPTVITGPHPGIVFTPGAEPSKDNFSYTSDLIIHRNGNLSGSADMKTKGWWAWAYREIFASIPSSHYGNVINMLLAPSGGGVGTFTHGNPTVLDKPFQVTANWTTASFVKVGNYLTFTIPAGPYLIPSLSATGSPAEYLSTLIGPTTRKHPVETYLGGVEWKTTIHIPKYYKAIYIPKSVNLTNSAGSFHSEVSFSAGTVTTNYNLKLNKVVYNPNEYVALRALLLSDLNLLKSPLVFVKS